MSESQTHALRLRSKGHPKGQARAKIHDEITFEVWLFGRMFSHLRNLIARELAKHKAGVYSAIGGDGQGLSGIHQDGCLYPRGSSTLPDEDYVDDVCDGLSPKKASIVRRLAEGQMVEDIAEDLGITPTAVKQLAQQVAHTRRSRER